MPRIAAVFILAALAAAGCAEDLVVTAAPPSSIGATTTTTTSVVVVPAPPVPIVETKVIPEVISMGPAVGDAVALTFDADLTPSMQARLRSGTVESYANMAVVDVLRQMDAPATIFFTGLWMEEYPAETADIAADPRFELGTHSQTHRAFRNGCYGLGVVPREEMEDEIRRPVTALSLVAPTATRYFRFPGLCHDDESLAAAASVGVTVVDGDGSGDAGGPSVDAIVDQTLRRAHPGSIIVMHLNGGDKAPLTDEALPRIIDGLQARGLRPAKLSEVLAAR